MSISPKITVGLMAMFVAQLSLAQVKLTKIKSLPDKLDETSGLVLYKKKFLLSHNDSGNRSEVYVLNLQGEKVKVVDVEETKNKDWEDMTAHKDGRVFIGDFGNNLNRREKCKIYILPNNFHEKKSVKPKVITFSYEDQKKFPPKNDRMNFDCEAFLCAGDYLYLFTKCRTKPFTGITYIYRLDAKAGKQEAKKMGSIQLCKSGWRFCSVTAADYHAPSRKLVLLTYTKMYIVNGFSGHKFWEGKVKSYSLPAIKQREAICFSSPTKLYMTDEYKKGFGGGNLYKVELKK